MLHLWKPFKGRTWQTTLTVWSIWYSRSIVLRQEVLQWHRWFLQQTIQVLFGFRLLAEKPKKNTTICAVIRPTSYILLLLRDHIIIVSFHLFNCALFCNQHVTFHEGIFHSLSQISLAVRFSGLDDVWKMSSTVSCNFSTCGMQSKMRIRPCSKEYILCT